LGVVGEVSGVVWTDRLLADTERDVRDGVRDGVREGRRESDVEGVRPPHMEDRESELELFDLVAPSSPSSMSSGLSEERDGPRRPNIESERLMLLAERTEARDGGEASWGCGARTSGTRTKLSSVDCDH
jgi:hypothetical protein